jgi:hypothetical protein
MSDDDAYKAYDTNYAKESTQHTTMKLRLSGRLRCLATSRGQTQKIYLTASNQLLERATHPLRNTRNASIPPHACHKVYLEMHGSIGAL